MTWMTVMPPYYIKVWNTTNGFIESRITNDFCFRQAGTST